MHSRRGRYSWFINPLLLLADLSIVVITIVFFSLISNRVNATIDVYPRLPRDSFFIIYCILLWVVISYFTKFYKIYRYTKEYKIIGVLIKQSILYILLLLAYFGFFKVEMSRKMILLYVVVIFSLIGVLKILIHYSLKKYRVISGGNRRTVAIVGNSQSVNQIINFFTKNKELGYDIKGVFSDNKNEGITGSISESIAFLKKQNVDEIYCSLDSLEDWQINKFIEIADKNFATIKFIPNKNSISADKVTTDFYGILPVFTLKKPALNNYTNQLLKRTFDIVFSILVIIFILSWLVPLLFFLIKLESKGPLFYKHIRYGLNYKEFYCFKFRSLKNENYDVLNQVTKNDQRVTKIGKFIRKTSIDELPQFFNVLLGDMSVVGPRPHMILYSNLYAKYFDKYKYMFRHSVKPGLTGLAQIKGYRGETEKDEDIINRVKYDIYYIENWNFIQDINIIIQTIINFIKGEEKAY